MKKFKFTRTNMMFPYRESEGIEEEPVEVAMVKRYREENPTHIYGLYGIAERKDD